METDSAYATGAVGARSRTYGPSATRGCLSGLMWQRASRPHVTRMLAMCRFPAVARSVYDAAELDAETSFTASLEWFLNGVARDQYI